MDSRLRPMITWASSEEERCEVWMDQAVGAETRAWLDRRRQVAKAARETLELVEEFEADFVAMVKARREAARRRRA